MEPWACANERPLVKAVKVIKRVLCDGERFCLDNCLVIAVLFAESLFKKRYEKADFAAPGPHAFRVENGKAHLLDICSC